MHGYLCHKCLYITKINHNTHTHTHTYMYGLLLGFQYFNTELQTSVKSCDHTDW